MTSCGSNIRNIQQKTAAGFTAAVIIRRMNAGMEMIDTLHSRIPVAKQHEIVCGIIWRERG